MNSLVTLASFNRAIDVPFNLPQSTLQPNTAEQVAIISVLPGQQLQLRWLSIHLVKINVSPVQIPTKINPSLATTYAGLIGDRAQFLTAPAGRPLIYVPVDLPGVAHSSPAFALDLSPGTYALIAVNNLVETSIEVTVCGSFRVTLPS